MPRARIADRSLLTWNEACIESGPRQPHPMAGARLLQGEWRRGMARSPARFRLMGQRMITAGALSLTDSGASGNWAFGHLEGLPPATHRRRFSLPVPVVDVARRKSQRFITNRWLRM